MFQWSSQTIAAVIVVVIVVLFAFHVTRPREPSLYTRLGGIYPIAAVVDHFSEAIVRDPIAGKDSPNPQLRQWYDEKMHSRMPGLKLLRTLWLCEQAGGPQRFVPSTPSAAGRCPLSLENAHAELRISPEEFDAVARVLSNTLDHFGIPEREKSEVLAVFAGHKSEVGRGYLASIGASLPKITCPRRLFIF
jgi:hemoglobin